MRTFTSLDEVAAATGTELGTSDWFVIDQDRIDRFAEATGDHQWIHVDPERAATGPFGTTIAHGFLTLSLVPFLGTPGLLARDSGRQAQLRRQQGPLPHPGAGGLAGARARRMGEVTDLPAGKQMPCATRSRSRASTSPRASRRRSSCCCRADQPSRVSFPPSRVRFVTASYVVRVEAAIRVESSGRLDRPDWTTRHVRRGAWTSSAARRTG